MCQPVVAYLISALAGRKQMLCSVALKTLQGKIIYDKLKKIHFPKRAGIKQEVFSLIKKIGKLLLVIVLLFAAAVAGYVIYMQVQYYRIADFTEIETQNPRQEQVKTETAYRIMTYNIGFGAYSSDYSFFMDTGEMKDGTKTVGEHARALSASEEVDNTMGSLKIIKKQDADFLFVQEADEKATRSYQVNQRQILEEELKGYASVFAKNFHSAYLFYPFLEPHGSVEAGMLTFSRYRISENIRRQFPVSNAFITKFTDLDRCFLVSRLPVEGEKELVLIQIHLSAYDEGGKIRARQLALLNEVLKEEREKGNYVIAGGDFNHDIADSMDRFPSEQKTPEWVYQLGDEDLAEGFHFITAENAGEVPTCRGADMPYEKGVTYTVIVDGFLVSDNVSASARNIDEGFLYSDHNPVVMEFTLRKE